MVVVVVVPIAREGNQRARARSGTGRWDDQERGWDWMAGLVVTCPLLVGKARPVAPGES